MDICRDTGVFGSSPRVLGHVLDGNLDPPLLEPEGPFRKQEQCRRMSDGSDWGGSEHTDLKELDWKVQTVEW